MTAEIRNRIYDFAADDDLDLLKQRYDAATGFARRTYAYIWFAGRQHGQYASLTQVCRKLRTEYLPIYNAQTVFAVKLEELAAYVDIFVNSSGTAQEDFVGNLIVSGSDYPVDTKFDFRVLMDTSSKTKLLNISWYSDASIDRLDMTPMLNAFLRPDEHQSLRNYVDRAITTIELRPTNYQPLTIWLGVRRQYWEYWMVYWNEDCDTSLHGPVPWGTVEDEVMAWVAATDLPLGEERANYYPRPHHLFNFQKTN